MPALRVIDEGDREQLPVVFLHAFPYHAGMWEGQRAALRGRARFVAYDARGMGPQAVHAAPFMLEHMVDDLLALLDRRGIERCLLCGLSMGGYVALRAVERAPERVVGLMLCNTQAGSDSDEAKLGRAAGVRLLASQGLAAFGEAQLARQLSPHTVGHAPDLLARLRAQIAESSAEGVAGCLVALATRTDQHEMLASIRVPTLVVVGEHDAITPPAVARALAARIPGAALHVLPQAGHLSNLEAESAFNALLLALVAQLSVR
jgi:pimeloyl-ACP methyl ester carboxylesterase